MRDESNFFNVHENLVHNVEKKRCKENLRGVNGALFLCENTARSNKFLWF